MFLIIEIILVVKAWRRGWRAWALVPPATTAFVGFLVGMAIAASGGTVDPLSPAILLGDVACIGVLGVMSVRPCTQTKVPDVQAIQRVVAAGVSQA
jgi:hypothetical protein